MLKHTRTVLPCGLNVVTVPMPSVKSVTVLNLVNTGSRYEEPHEEGIAHFLEHMVFKGTNKYPTAQVLASEVDGVGANFNAFTSKEYTGFYVQASSKHLYLALDVISDMLLTPQLREDDLEREKGVIVEEINMYADTPSRHIADIFENMMYRGSGLGHNVIGSKETVTALQVSDFQKYLRQWYGLGNMVLALAGDAKVLEDPKLLDEIENFYTKGKDTRAIDRVNLDAYLHKDPIAEGKILVHHKPTEQAHFIIAYPGIDRRHPDRYPLALLSTLLGGNMSSRLFIEVREQRGLCYYVRSDVDHYHNTGAFGASAGVDPKRVDEALKVTIGEFEALIDGSKPVTAHELQKAKDYVAGKMVLGLEDSESVAQYFGMKQLLNGEIETPEQVMEKIKAVTLEDVQRIATNLIKNQEIRFGIIGPFKDEGRFAKILA
jgi:predicted Zn-dependent peptidase